MAEIIQVGMADYKLAQSPDKLITAGLGSCVGVCLLDSRRKIASMCHIMLPYSNPERPADNPAKYADTGIMEAIMAMQKAGADIRRLVAKIAGGAQMFRFSGNDDFFRVGERNVQSVEKTLAINRIALLSKDVGGSIGRTITFDPETGNLLIRTIRTGEKII